MNILKGMLRTMAILAIIVFGGTETYTMLFYLSIIFSIFVFGWE